jgi:amidophosphoribosyltransferase
VDGITGIYSIGEKDLVQKAFLATGALQHRGKASAGIAVGNAKGIYVHKDVGGLADVVGADIVRMFQDLEPMAAIGNVGYTKNLVPEKTNAEPVMVKPRLDSPVQIALTVNGRIVGDEEIQRDLEGGYLFETNNRTEILGALLHRCLSEEGVTFDAGRTFVNVLHGRGSFALAALVHDGREIFLITLNDDRAFEPFCFGTVDGAFVAASESCAHRRLGGFIEREYRGAEMTICSRGGVETRRLREEPPLPDVFQGVYFGNVASVYHGQEIFVLRKRLGHQLAARYGDPGADLVIPNPDSGWGVSFGIAESLGKPIVTGLVKQAQAIRTFQESGRRKRMIQVGLKFAGIDSVLGGRKVIMGDDSIVKGSVSEGGAVWTAYNSGVKALEFWVSYAPMFFPSFKEWRRGRECLDELAAQRAFPGGIPYDKTVDEINRAVAKLAGIDRVCYNTPEDVAAVTGPGSFQALEAGYPVSEEYWPNWLKEEVEMFHHYR